MAEVPEDLRHWFDTGSMLAMRHNLPRIETRWRVIEVEVILGDVEAPYVVKGEWREFKTQQAAARYRDKLAKAGAAVLMQPGFTFWPDNDEWP